MKLTAAYYRSSTELQEDSVDNQQFHLQNFALQKDLLIDLEYPEPHVSARKVKLYNRPEMSRLIADIRKGKIGTLLAYKRDRLARKVEEHLELYRIFKMYQVKVYFIAENEPEMRFDIFGEIMELFIGVMNQREGEQINMRIADTRINNFLSGKTIGSLPYGYETNIEKTKILKIDNELKMVQIIFEKWNTDLFITTQQLADKLNEEKYNRRGNPWKSNHILGILTNPIYYGIRIMNFNKKPLEKPVEGISVISPEVFNLAQDLLEKRRKPKKEIVEMSYLLSNLLVCSLCNTPLLGSKRMVKGETYGTYECKEHKIQLKQDEIERSVYQKTREFFEELLETHFDILYQSHIKKASEKLLEKQKDLERSLKLNEDKLVNYTNQWIKKDTQNNMERVTEYAEKVKEIKGRIFSLVEKRIEYNDNYLSFNNLKMDVLQEKNWNNLPFKRKCELLSDLIQQIKVDDFSTCIVFKHPYLEGIEVHP